MSKIGFNVTVEQSWKENYHVVKDGQEQNVEFERSGEIHGKFYDWEAVQVFVNTVLSGFENATIEIKIVRED